MVGLTALSRHCVPLHAAAFVHDGVGVVLSGFPHCGKTAALLAFTENGAEYISDDAVLLRGNGELMYGSEQKVELAWHHLRRAPRLRGTLPLRRRALLGMFGWLSAYAQRSRGGSSGMLRKLGRALARRMRLKVHPRAVFGEQVRSLVGPPNQIVLVLAHNEPRITLERTDPISTALRLQKVSVQAQSAFWARYRDFKFAFPGAENPFLEQAQSLQEDLLCRALAPKQTFLLHLPGAVSFEELFCALTPALMEPGHEGEPRVEGLRGCESMPASRGKQDD